MAKALKERDRLRSEARAAAEAGAAARDRIELIDRDLTALAQRRREALAHEARTGDAADLDQLDHEQQRLERDRARAMEAARAAGEAKAAAARELSELHRAHADEFVAYCEDWTRAAHKAFAELRPAYDEAALAWHRARKEWATIAADLGLAATPHCPLLPAGAVFAVAARPRNVRPAEGAPHEPVTAAAHADPPGATVEWEHVNGDTLSTFAGTEMHARVADDPDWRRIEPKVAA